MTPTQIARSTDGNTTRAITILKELEANALTKRIALACDPHDVQLARADTIAALLIERLRLAVGWYIATGRVTPSKQIGSYDVENLYVYIDDDLDIGEAIPMLRELAARLAATSSDPKD